MTLAPRRHLAVLPLGLLAAVAVAACGGSGSSARGASSPQAAVKTYLTGVGTGNGAQACSVLATSLQNRALSVARGQGIKASSCADLFSQVKAHMTSTQEQDFLNAKVTNVSQSGSSATATVAGGSAQPTLAESAGKWLITGGVGF